MMALQLQRSGAWSHDALQVVFKPPWRRNNEPAHKLQPRAHSTDKSLIVSLIDNEFANGSNSKLALAADRWKEISPRNFVASPRYSSLLKLTRRRRHELRMRTRDRVYMSISDWVFRQVKDPLVEIDPVTVNEAILAEKQAGKNDADSTSTVPTTSSPSWFGYLPPGFPKGADNAALAAAIVLVLAALATWAILALRGNKNSGSVPVVASGQDPNGSVTNGGARQEMEGDRSPGWQEPLVGDQAMRKPAVPVVTSSFESQTAAIIPIPQYSTALVPSDLPLPPSFGANTKDQKIDSPPTGEIGSIPDDELVVPLVTLQSHGVADAVDHLVEAHEMAAIDEEIISTNGVVKGDSPLEEVAADLESAAIEEMVASPLLEELATMTTGSQEELGPGSISEPVVSGKLPSASESLEQISVDEEYILIGKSHSLSPIGDLPAPAQPIAALPSKADVGIPVDSILADSPAAEPIAALPAEADVGVPVDSILFDNSAGAQPPSEELSLEKIDVIFTSVQEEVPGAVSAPLTEFQVGSDAGGVEERRKEYAQAIEKVLPAVSVGAGVAALSVFSGVDGALQVVGALAAASFVKEFIWAGPRQQLLDEIRNIKSHQELKQFLKDKDILPQSWSH